MKIPEKTLLEILETARFAPSVHNLQPWKVETTETGLVILVDNDHGLVDGDPTGRETTISLGIFTEAVIIVAKSKNLSIQKVEYKNHRVTLEFTSENTSTDTDRLNSLIRSRSTDRSIYKQIEIPSILKSDISRISDESELTHAILIDDKAGIDLVAKLTAKGIGLALSNPNFRKELSSLLVEPWSTKKRGISLKSLYIPLWLAVIQPIVLKLGWANHQEVQLELKRWQSASGIVFITGKGDLANYWFDAGRTYFKAALAIENSGLSQATSAAIVEASDYHTDLEIYLNTSDRILCVIRVGRGKKRRQYSPRVTPTELLT